MTIEEVRGKYDVDPNGIIRSPGKFEGEHWSSVAAYDIVMNGGANDTLYWSDGMVTDIILTGNELRKEWDLDQDTVAVSLEETDQGFISCAQLDQALLDQTYLDYDLDSSEEEEEEEEE